MTKMKLIIERINENAIIPTYGSEFASGADLYSVENLIIHPFKRAIIHTGIRLRIPEGYEVQIRPRSGLSVKHGLTIVNSPGSIDQDYVGEIMVIAHNTDDTNPIEIKIGDRIAQMIIAPVVCGKNVNIEEGLVDERETTRGNKGLGSTGV